jgi:hypothetical protein
MEAAEASELAGATVVRVDGFRNARNDRNQKRPEESAKEGRERDSRHKQGRRLTLFEQTRSSTRECLPRRVSSSRKPGNHMLN